LDLEMSGNMLYHFTLCLVGLKNAHAFHVAGDCRDLLEGRSSWEGGDSWGMRAATMGSPDWNLLLEFDRPLQGLEVYNGAMETEDMKQFKIAPEKYLRHHQAPVDVNFLVDYGTDNPPAKLKYINVNGKTHNCKEGLGELSGNPRSGRLGGQRPQFRTYVDGTVIEKKITRSDVVAKLNTDGTAESRSVISCTAADANQKCQRVNTLTFTVKEVTCPQDLMPAACTMLGAALGGCVGDVFKTTYCYNTCFCHQTG